jgi:hypothetical protein
MNDLANYIYGLCAGAASFLIYCLRKKLGRIWDALILIYVARRRVPALVRILPLKLGD